MNKQKQIHKGFTLIELMIAIAVVAILVALAVPAYRDYTIRAKVAECVHNTAVAKVQISEYRQSFGDWPATADEAAISFLGLTQFCQGYSNYDASSGAFTIEVDTAAVDPVLTTLTLRMTPTANTFGIINWNCTRGGTIENDLKYIPTTCRDANP